MITSKLVSKIAAVVVNGGIIAYPTEAVFGLGCRADNDDALKRLLAIKQRPVEKGMLLVFSQFSQLDDYIQPLSKESIQKIQSISSTPTTWVVPAKDSVSPLLTGEHKTLGIRLIQHPLIQQLCDQLDAPLVSTSANPSGEKEAFSTKELDPGILSQIDAVLDASTGGYSQPSQIIDILTNQVLRP